MKTIFRDIQDRLKTIPELHEIGEDWGQLNFEQPPVKFPCALIDLGMAGYQNRSQNTQQVDALVNITVADIRYHGINPNLPPQQQQSEFAIFTLLDKINIALHGTGGDTYNRLMRESVKKIMRSDTIREFIIQYRFSYVDTLAAPHLTPVKKPGPAISIK